MAEEQDSTGELVASPDGKKLQADAAAQETGAEVSELLRDPELAPALSRGYVLFSMMRARPVDWALLVLVPVGLVAGFAGLVPGMTAFLLVALVVVIWPALVAGLIVQQVHAGVRGRPVRPAPYGPYALGALLLLPLHGLLTLGFLVLGGLAFDVSARLPMVLEGVLVFMGAILQMSSVFLVPWLHAHAVTAFLVEERGMVAACRTGWYQALPERWHGLTEVREDRKAGTGSSATIVFVGLAVMFATISAMNYVPGPGAGALFPDVVRLGFGALMASFVSLVLVFTYSTTVIRSLQVRAALQGLAAEQAAAELPASTGRAVEGALDGET